MLNIVLGVGAYLFGGRIRTHHVGVQVVIAALTFVRCRPITCYILCVPSRMFRPVFLLVLLVAFLAIAIVCA